jgi:uncharacterized ParB-like nuclease family protein
MNQQGRRRAKNQVPKPRYVITLAPGDVIGFRKAQSRTTFWTTLSKCHAMAARDSKTRRKAPRARSS